MAQRPNILLLFSDEQRHDTVGAAGCPWMITPNLDRLARAGCLFTHGHTPNPVCVPARHSLLTGRCCSDHGFLQNGGRAIRDPGMPTLPRTLAVHGYATHLVGKAHFKPVREHHGFGQLHLMEEVPTHPADDQYVQFLAAHGHGDARAIHGIRPYLWNAPQCSPLPDAVSGSRWVAETAIDLIERNRDRPWFIQCGFISPHPPFPVPEHLQGIYAGRELPAPVPPDRRPPYYDQATPWAGDDDPPAERRRVWEAYLSMITHVDEQVGRLLDHLESIGQLDHTLVIYTSDHGEMLGDHGMWGKMKPFEASVRVPFIVRWPERFAPGSVDHRLVDLCDILPTCLDAAGIDRAELGAHDTRLLGGSLLPGAEPRRDFGHQWCEFGALESGRWVSLRDARYKYVFFHGGGFEYLFDLERDPLEQRNLIDSGDLPAAVHRALKDRCTAMEAAYGPPGAVVDGELAVLPHRAGDDPLLRTEKFVQCGFDQLPRFGRGAPQEEAERFVADFIRATACLSDAELIDYAPTPRWREWWHEAFIAYGGTEAQWRRMMRLDPPCPAPAPRAQATA